MFARVGCVLVCVVALLAVVAVAAPKQSESVKPSLSGSFLLGYNGGAGGQAAITISNLASGFPFALRFGVGYVSLDPGKPAEARINFINDATNGTPEESGHRYDYRLDFMSPVHWFGFKRAFALGGVRHSRYTGTFNYVGGNEKFNVTTNQWGLGLGLESYFAMSRRVDLMLSAGVDQYFKSTLSGHDTSYSPNGESVNGRDGYDYKTADDAINQPKTSLRVMMGIAYAF
jgi:opacity protein-like surface antigen